MKFIILTLFPESFDYLKSYGVIGKAIQNNLIELEVVNIRDYTKNKHKKSRRWDIRWRCWYAYDLPTNLWLLGRCEQKPIKGCVYVSSRESS